MDELDAHWLAGLLEGEGSFLKAPPSEPNKPGISIEMTDRDVMERVGAMVGRKVVVPARRGKWQQTYKVTVRGWRAVDLMQRLRPLLGRRRQEQIDRAVAGYDPTCRAHRERLRQVLPSGLELRRLRKRFSLREIASRFGCSPNAIWLRTQESVSSIR